MNWRMVGLAVLTLAVGLLGVWFTLRVIEVDGQPPPRPKPMEWRDVLERLRREAEQQGREGEADEQPGEDRKYHEDDGLGESEEGPGDRGAEPREAVGGHAPSKRVRPAVRRPRMIWPAGDYPGLERRGFEREGELPQGWPTYEVPRVRGLDLIDEWRRSVRWPPKHVEEVPGLGTVVQ